MTSIKINCGNCKAQHPSVEAVRECYGLAPVASGTPSETVRQGRAHEATLPLQKPFVPQAPAAFVPLATEKQVAFILRLAGERMWEGAPEKATVAAITALVNGERKMQKRGASDAIEFLLARPTKPTATTHVAPAPVVPAGRYALPVDGAVKFYRVDCPTEGKWAGRTFVKVQASDDLYPVRGTSADQVLAAIAADPRSASLLYGQQIGSCGVCGRTLTDESSRAAGIGPICASKTGW